MTFLFMGKNKIIRIKICNNLSIMKHWGIFSLLLLLLFSCTSRDKSRIEEIYSIKLDDAKETTLTYSDIMNIQEWVLLDSLNECIIGDIAKIEEFERENLFGTYTFDE